MAAFAAAAAGCAGQRPVKTAAPPSPTVEGAAGDCRPIEGAALLSPIGTARQSSTVALAKLGERTVALIADEDARAVVLVDVEKKAEIGSTPVDGAPSQLLVTKDGRVVVALRDVAKLVVLAPAAGAEPRLAQRCAVRAAAEPLALASTPDDATVLVTHGIGHALSGYDEGTLAKRFEVDLPREPRAVVVSGDGKRAFVSHAVGGRLSAVDLERAFHPIRNVDLRHPDAGPRITSCQGYALARLEVGSSGRVLAPEAVVDPGDLTNRPDGYGDGNSPAEQPAVAVLDESAVEPIKDSLNGVSDDDASVNPSDRLADCLLPRAAAVDSASHTLLVACYGIDAVIAYDALAPIPAHAGIRRYAVGGGPSGIAVDPDHGRAVVWSQFDRVLSVLPIRTTDPMAELGASAMQPTRIALASVHTSADAYRRAVGRQLFHAVNDPRISSDGRACASCHPDGRDDAITWATPDGPRRSVMLAGRLSDTAPYGWNGAGHDVREHLAHTFDRLKGTGLSSLELESLLAYVQSLQPPALPAPPKATPADIAHGDEIFHSKETGCATCHAGSGAGTDGKKHDVGSKAGSDRAAAFDTPSLRFVSAHAPYFHDGRYASLHELLRATDSGMGETKHLTEADLDALEAYLRSL